MVICPYDKSHEIEPERMQFHLVKCAKNHPNQDIVACCYNNLHRIPKPELSFHLKHCPDKRKLDTFMHEIGDMNCPVNKSVSVNEESVPHGSENWDKDPPCPSALEGINQEIEEKPVVRALKISSKAKKRDFHLQERQRLNELTEATAKIKLGSAPLGKDTHKNPSVPNTAALSGNTGRGWSTIEPVAGPSSAMPGTSTSTSGRLSNIRDEFPSLPGTSTSGRFSNIRNEFPSLPGTSTSGRSSNIRDEFPSLPAPSRSSGFCNLPIPGRGRGRAKNKE